MEKYRGDEQGRAAAGKNGATWSPKMAAQEPLGPLVQQLSVFSTTSCNKQFVGIAKDSRCFPW
ncbi:hypothetical protein E2C01_095927 [Portunus trituberculatus]|uniref:Uncharacterized protein n=1 Tax=Portunus trituberculatus TaxID=210409 RepID=A0A5B7K1F5_PORTR|nr:hypothetical protein [Portunus trituberculatus]